MPGLRLIFAKVICHSLFRTENLKSKPAGGLERSIGRVRFGCFNVKLHRRTKTTLSFRQHTVEMLPSDVRSTDSVQSDTSVSPRTAGWLCSERNLFNRFS